MAAFDAASAISEFLTDAARTSLELPHMTTGQRKHTKTLIAQHPELRSESYGLGSERRLHVFKIGFEQMALKSSIDSTPPQDTLVSVPDLAKQDVPHFDGCSSKLPVRNTFIDIDYVPADERAVQSMPHGMFRQCMLAEMSYKTSCQVADAAAPMEAFDTEVDGVGWPLTPVSEPEAEPTALAANKCMAFGLGALVIVEGLTKLPGFNGLSAVVQAWDQASERYSIMLVTGGACHQAKIKEENLRLLLPCP